MEIQNDLMASTGFSPSRYPLPVTEPAAKFNDILGYTLQKNGYDTGAPSQIQTTGSGGKEKTSGLYVIGQTTGSSPTVSHVLLNDSTLKDKTWQIILSDINKDKAYTAIPLGSQIYYNSDTGELSWSKSDHPENSGSIGALPAEEPAFYDYPPTIKKEKDKVVLQTGSEAQSVISLGRLSGDAPTVSHLLADSPEFAEEKWNILASDLNKYKNFNTIPENSEILIDPLTMELSWTSISTAGNQEITQLAADKQKILFHPGGQKEMVATQDDLFINSSAHAINWFNQSEATHGKGQEGDENYPPDLTEAVKPFIGVPYHEIDCYGLVVKGLKNMGVQYSGKDGLRSRLTAMAKNSGLPSNAFLTGEGIIQATGKKVFTQSLYSIKDSVKQAEKTFEKMKPVLQKGQILSFSTPTRGHTGIISQHNEQWTFINSGRMDNNVSENILPEEVGEEDLYHEVLNWFKLAQENRESLVVTLGEIETSKIRNTLQPGIQLSQRM
jgi:hypothetical protein